MEKKQKLEKIKTIFLKLWDFANKEANKLRTKSYIWLILVFAFLERLYAIGSLGVSGAELKNIDRILSVSSPQSFFRADLSTGLYYALQYLWGRAVGFSVINMRFFSVMLSIVGLYFFFLFVREWFSKRSAYISTFLLSISSFDILISRAISHEILYMAIVFPALYLLTLAYRRKKLLYFMLAGALFGFLLYATEIAFTLAIVLGISAIYFYLKNEKFLTGFFKGKTVMAISAALVSAPFLIWIFANPYTFLGHFSLGPVQVADNARSLVLSVVYATPAQLMYNIGSSKLFDPYVEVTFLLGLTYAALKFKRRKFYFLLSWFLVLFLAGIIEKGPVLSGFTYLAPLIFIFSAVIQSHVLRKWFKTFPFNKFARLGMALGIGFFFALSLSLNYRKVFLAWDKYPERRLAYNAPVASVDLKNESIFIYKPDLSSADAYAIIKNGANNNISFTNNLSDIKTSQNFVILTSPQNVFAVKSKLSNIKFKEIDGQDVILLKGE